MKRPKGDILPFTPRGADEPGQLARPAVPILLSLDPPRPVMTRLIHLPLGNPTATAVLRFWADGDMERCTLCRRCSGEDNVCFVGINRVVPRSEAATLSDHGCDWVGDPSPPSPRASV